VKPADIEKDDRYAASLPVSPPFSSAGVGIPLTMPQLEAEGLPALVSRLVGRRHYLLAVRICLALGLSTEQVGAGGSGGLGYVLGCAGLAGWVAPALSLVASLCLACV
jgi:hypothetical protein